MFSVQSSSLRTDGNSDFIPPRKPGGKWVIGCMPGRETKGLEEEDINFRSIYCDEPCSLSLAVEEVGESAQGL